LLRSITDSISDFCFVLRISFLASVATTVSALLCHEWPEKNVVLHLFSARCLLGEVYLAGKR
jgi:hypothetical protein